MNDLHWLGAGEVRAAYENGTLRPSDYLDALLDRIHRHDGRLNVFTSLQPDVVRRQARQADAALRSGRGNLGRLHGIPVAIKDNIDVLGLPTTCCSRLMAGHLPARQAVVVDRLQRAGAIVLGKVATWEFALGGPSHDLPLPPARNPWNRDRQPGGSSSGSGAGLAAGFFPLAVGTDTGGSIRFPAAACGVAGLKPTYGLVPCHGVFPLAYSLDHVGPMARSVDDVALLLDAMTDCPRPTDTGASSPRPLAGWKVGFVRHFHETDLVADPQVGAALDRAAGVFSTLGAHVAEVRLPPLDDFASVNRVILYSEVWSIHKPRFTAHPEQYGQVSRRRIPAGAFLGAGQYVTAQRRRAVLQAHVARELATFDVLLCANALDPAGPIDAAATGSPVNSRQARTPFNVTGHPAISLMSGLSADGLPLSLQLVGRPCQEQALLRAARAYQRHDGFDALHPELA